MVETRSKSRASATTKNARSTLNPFASEFDECRMVNPLYAKCTSKDTQVETPYLTENKLYNRFVTRLLKSCTPYTGKRVFVVKSGNFINYVCPNYTLKVGKSILSISFTPQGYMYVHFLKHYVKGTKDCLFSGDHLTIAPSGTDNIHFHITKIQYQIDETETIVGATSYNTSFCSIPIKMIMSTFNKKSLSTEQKQEWLLEQMCLNEYSVSFNKTVADMLYQDSDMKDIVFEVFMSGFVSLNKRT